MLSINGNDIFYRQQRPLRTMSAHSAHGGAVH